jgi:hypothetical protein
MAISNGFRFAVAATLALTLHGVSFAGSDGEDQPSKQSETAPSLKVPDIGGTGTLDYSYDIDVPSFHGAEPKLTLNYSSTRKTKTGGLYQGWLGYGWGFKGFDVIERARHKGTIPAFDGTAPSDDGNDVFLLNGEELLKCSADQNTSASCKSQTGPDRYVSETENYLQISRDRTSNSWTIVNREGTRMLLKPAGYFTGDTGASALSKYARWLVQSITDTNGNKVTYTYACPTLPVCYPQTITYNTTTIKFFLENRPDDIVTANGQSLSIIDQRINAIRVVNGTSVVAAYQLVYETAPAPGSGASRLLTIKRYGSNADVNATTGAVTLPGGGLGPKLTSFKYAEYNNFAAATDTGIVNGLSQYNLRPRWTAVDVDSDGMTELLDTGANGTCWLYNRKSSGAFSKVGINGVHCNADSKVDYPSTVPSADIALPGFSLGHFANDVKQTQMLFRWDDTGNGQTSTADPSVKASVTFKKQSDETFNVIISTCANNGITDSMLFSQCGKDHPKTQVVDFDGDGRDSLQTTQDNNAPGGITA